MFAFGSKGTPHIQPSLFDIRVHSQDRNVLFLSGQTGEANSLYITGHVVFAIPETIIAKAVSLNLVGTFRLDFLESFQDSEGKIIASCPVRKENVVVKVEWKNLLTSTTGVVEIANSKRSASPPQLSQFGISKLKGKTNHLYFDESIPAGTTPFPDVTAETGGSTVFELPRGNYSLPFDVVLPGDIPETVEGLQCGVILYRLQSKIEGAKQFKREPVASKYLRIFRTPLLEELTFSEDCTVENTWPGKVQYEVHLPKKAIALGGKTKIHILIVPLVKDLQLGKISASVEQSFALKGDDNESFEDKKTVFQCDMPRVPMDELNQDRWSMEATIAMPQSLKQCSPDISLKDDLIRVKNKLILDINITNPDGHTSQVRSKLPIFFYISGTDKLLGRNAYVDMNGRVRFKAGSTPLFDKAADEAAAAANVSASAAAAAAVGGPNVLTGVSPQAGPATIPDGSSATSSVSSDDTAESGQASSNGSGTVTSTPTNSHGSAGSAGEIAPGVPAPLPPVAAAQVHQVEAEGRSQEIVADPNYEAGGAVDSHRTTEVFLPSYKDAENDTYLDPSTVSPLVSPLPINPLQQQQQQSVTSYFDLDPAILHRSANATTALDTPGVPTVQYISMPPSEVTTPKFDESLNEVPSYSQVYDADFVVNSEPAPLYESLQVSDKEFGDLLKRRVAERRAASTATTNSVTASSAAASRNISAPSSRPISPIRAYSARIPLSRRMSAGDDIGRQSGGNTASLSAAMATLSTTTGTTTATTTPLTYAPSSSTAAAAAAATTTSKSALRTPSSSPSSSSSTPATTPNGGTMPQQQPPAGGMTPLRKTLSGSRVRSFALHMPSRLKRNSRVAD